MSTQTGTSDQPLPESKAWRRLTAHRQELDGFCLKTAFAQDPQRAAGFSLELGGLFVDYSRSLITNKTVSLLLKLARTRQLEQAVRALFSGQDAHPGERRPAAYTLLRTPPPDASAPAAVAETMRRMTKERERMLDFAQRLQEGQITGSTGQPIRRVVNIGVGGSEQGPRLVTEALCEYRHSDMEMNFVANLDPFELARVLARADPETTLFILVSNSFTTTDTLVNARRARHWLQEQGCRNTAAQLLAVTGNVAAARRFGIDEQYCFSLPPWTVGRYSVWSNVGISAAISIGGQHFRQFLAGAQALDAHFRSADFRNNIPVMLALTGIWHNNFFAMGAHAVIPYDQRLERLPAYLAQLAMESNGKSVSKHGERLGVNTTPVIWGSVGSNAQHSVFQFLHQGARRSSVDLLLPLSSPYDERQHALLVANCLAQSEALMRGRTDAGQAHKNLDGNRPSTTIAYDSLDPYTLGMLLALYEHKTFVESVIWGNNPFDQPGVELGKTLAGELAAALTDADNCAVYDASTQQLIDKYYSLKR